MAAFLALAAIAAAAACPMSAATIFEAPSIAVMRIETASPGAWTTENPNERQRTAALDLVVERVFRGPLRAGERVRITAEQHEPTGHYFAVSGAWSGKPLDRGARYVVFARSLSETLRVSDAGAATDVEMALDLENHKWPLGELARRVGPRKRWLGPLFAEYLNPKLPEVIAKHAEEWDSILSFLEDRELALRFRAFAATGAIDAVLMLSPAPEPVVKRTAVMAFRMLALPDEIGLHDRLVRTYLPNLVGIEGSEPKRPAADIFTGFPRERERAANALADVPVSDARTRLQNWLAK